MNILCTTTTAASNTHQSPANFIRVRLGADGAPWCDGLARYSAGHVLPRADAANPDGVFASWTWDGTTLEARTDRYGMAPLYYARLADGVMVSPSIHDLIAQGAPADLDLDALAVILRFGQPLEDDTPFAAIRALPPSGHLVWRAGSLTVDGHYPAIAPQSCSRAAAIDAYIDLFRAAIARRLPDENFMMPLSGGRDSRHILLELCHQGRKPESCVTSFGFLDAAHDHDVGIAAELCRMLAIPHQTIAAPSAQIGAAMAATVAVNYASAEHGWTLTLGEFLAAKTTLTFDGLAGDVLSAGHLFTVAGNDALVAGDAGRFAASVFVTDEYFLRQVVAPRIYGAIPRERAVARLGRALQRHQAAANPLLSFNFWNRTRRNIAQVPFSIYGGVQTVYVPYLDWDLFNFLGALDPGLTLGKSLHSDAIAKAYPTFNHIPYAAGWADVPARRLERHCGRLAFSLARRLLTGRAASLVNRQALLARLARHTLSGSARVTVPSFVQSACLLLAIEELSLPAVAPARSVRPMGRQPLTASSSVR